MPNLGTNFYPKLVQIASELGMKPEDILAIMVSESGINPSSYEKGSKGSGLIGFMPSTLHNLGYKGSWQDFIKTSGEEQLDYVKKYIEDKIRFNGSPFKSAAQYYVANFWPVALKLPGIKSEDPSTVFIEENPRTITRDGHRYSKKYYDIGFKIDPAYERSAYKSNPLFHGDVPGAITYGDMIRQVKINKSGKLYQQAISAMSNSTNYQAPTSTPLKTDTSFMAFFHKLEQLLSSFAAAPSHRYLISVGSSADHYTTMEYARILSTALNEYFDAEVSICADQANVEIECQAQGDKRILFDAIKELSVGVSDAFKHATRSIGNISTFALVTADLKSDYPLLHPKRADLCWRTFHLKFARNK